jgi:hypothetical protein
MQINRFLWPAEINEFLSTVLLKCRNKTMTIKKDLTLWRAQLGHDWESFRLKNNHTEKMPSPFSAERMKPQSDRAKEGRTNPKGIPYLYTAEEKETAMAEVRPGLGSRISVAQLKTLKEVKLIDFTGVHNLRFLSYLFETDTAKIDEFIWSEIGDAFSKPVNPSDDLAEYVPTQIMAELFKNNGFDGIYYNSAFGSGHNLLLFDIHCVKIIDCKLYEVKNIHHEFIQSPETYL